MRKVILLNMMTLDGYFDGPGEGFEKIDWHHQPIMNLASGWRSKNLRGWSRQIKSPDTPA